MLVNTLILIIHNSHKHNMPYTYGINDKYVSNVKKKNTKYHILRWNELILLD